jgi:diguanylate cyclase (GGDEF)-like protein/PAS domain S-box-containing protein
MATGEHGDTDGRQLDFRELFDTLPTAYLVMSPDLVIVEANRAYLSLLGRAREELVGRPVFEAFPPDPDSLNEQGLDPLQMSFERVRHTGRPDTMPILEYAVLDSATGAMVKRYWSLVNAPLQGQDGSARLVVQRVEDVTDYVRERTETADDGDREQRWEQRVDAIEAELFARMRDLRAAQDAAEIAAAELEASEQRARAVLDTAVDGIITIDAAGVVQSVNRAAERLFGYAPREIVGRNVKILMPEPYRSEHDGYLERYLRTREPRIIGSGREAEGRRKDGTTFPVELSVSEVDTDPPLYTGVVRDITERKRLEEELTRQALHDPLTGLANRTLVLDRLQHALSRLERHPGVVALLFIDLDRFKVVNDTLGHEAGDELLVQIAARLEATVRPGDLVARLGGDEFVVLCEDLGNAAAAESIARRLVETVRSPLPLRAGEAFVSASVGVVTDTGQRTASELLGDADAAMYRAKEQGRARYIVLDDAARARADDLLQLGADLHRALDRGELTALYQPLVHLTSGEVLAAEALVRWQHPRRGLLAPGAFLPLADDLGLTSVLDSWMLRAASRQAASTGRLTGRPVGAWVNLSSRSFADRRLVDTVTDALRDAGLDPGLLTLEITEGALMQDAAATVRVLRALKDIGVQLAVDDFGTGYSSLAYLQQFPVHALKVDRSFVAQLDGPAEQAEASAAIVQAIVNLAAGLGLTTVAEGIETAGQLAAVTALGCDLGQGYFLGRPTAGENLSIAVRTGAILPAAMVAELGWDVA